jgi:hypothetical protein
VKKDVSMQKSSQSEVSPVGTVDPELLSSSEPLERCALAGIVAGVLALIPHLPQIVAVVFVSGLVLLGPGSAFLSLFQRLRGPLEVVMAPALGIAAVLLLTTLQIQIPWWSTNGTTALLCALTSVLLLIKRVLRDWGYASAAPVDVPERSSWPTAVPSLDQIRSAARHGRLTLILLGGALVCWFIALPTVGDAKYSDWGLLASASPLVIAALVLGCVGFAVAVRRRSTGLAALATFVVAGMYQLTITLGTSAPLYTWSYKHVAVADFFASYGHVAPNIDIYNNWPGFFSAVAWFSQATHLSVLGIAHWYTPVYMVAIGCAVYAFARVWGAAPLKAVVVVFIFEMLHGLGQAYFSPQSIAMLLAVPILAVLGVSKTVASRPYVVGTIVVLFAAITVTHQLTPYWLLILIVLLTLVRRVRPFWLAVPLAAIALGYLGLHYTWANRYGVGSTNFGANITTAVQGQRKASAVFASHFSDQAGNYLLVIIVATAGIVLLRMLFTGQRPWAQMIMCAAPVLIIPVQPYGGEVITRALLYAMPMLALLISGPLVSFMQSRRPLVAVLTGGILSGLVLVSSQWELSHWFAYKVAISDLRVADASFKVAAGSPQTLLVSFTQAPLVSDYHYVDFINHHQYRSLFTSNARVKTDFSTKADYEALMTYLEPARKEHGSGLIMVMTQQAQDYGQQFGTLRPNTVNNFERWVTSDPRWTVIAKDGNSLAVRFTN